VSEHVRAAAAATGSVLLHLLATAHTMFVAGVRGDLVVAAAELREVLELAQEFGIGFGIPTLLSYGADALLERRELADLAELAETLPLGPLADVSAGAMMIEIRGRLRFAAGRREAAIADLRHAGSVSEGVGFTNPGGYPCWRSNLALMLGADDREEALALVNAELADASRGRRPRRIGIALRARGVLDARDAEGLADLEASVATLASTPARLEHARSLVELGAALRRRGRRADARVPLREGLELAGRCGATRLGERAQTELAASGAKPRRAYVTGPAALTPSEQRVARLAAEGHTSKQIAQALFVTTRTVDTHLGHAYTKLGIDGRTQLGAALAQDRQQARKSLPTRVHRG
jgi:DNA-binding CsgD family transcriptional regulator